MSDVVQRFIEFLGVVVQRVTDSEFVCDCLLCLKEGHLYFARSEGAILFSCKRCGREGDRATFLRAVFDDIYKPALNKLKLRRLAAQIGVPPNVTARLDIGYCEYRRSYAFLVCDARGQAVDIRFRRIKTGKTLSTPGSRVGLWGHADVVGVSDAIVYLVEGETDRIRLIAKFMTMKMKRPWVVVAVPGAGIFKNEWAADFAGRDVVILYDHDDAGRNGERKVFEALRLVSKSIRCLHWASDKHSGYDIRDALNDGIAWKQIKSWLRAEPRLPLQTVQATQAIVPDFINEYIHVVQMKLWYHKETLQSYDKEQFDNLHAVVAPSRGALGRASEQFLNSPHGQRIENVTYQPGAPRLLPEQNALNLYRRPPDLQPVNGDITPLLTHSEKLLPDAFVRKHTLQFMAYTVQYPERKINHAVFIGGRPGAGKDALFEPLRHILGEQNIAIISPDDVAGIHTDWAAEMKLGLVQEFAAFDKRQTMDRLKPFLASPPAKLRINGKYRRQYYIPNIANFVFMSNHEDALLLEEDDRRFLVYWSPMKPESAAYYRELYDWIRNNVAAIYGYLLSLDLSDFDAIGPAPMTTDKVAMIRDSRSPVEQYLRAQLEACADPLRADLVQLVKVVGAIPSHVRGASIRSVAQSLRKLGAREMSRQIRIRREGRKDERPRVWAVRRVEMYEQMSEQMLTAKYLEQHPRPLMSLRAKELLK